MGNGKISTKIKIKISNQKNKPFQTYFNMVESNFLSLSASAIPKRIVFMFNAWEEEQVFQCYHTNDRP